MRKEFTAETKTVKKEKDAAGLLRFFQRWNRECNQVIAEYEERIQRKNKNGRRPKGKRPVRGMRTQTVIRRG